MLPPSNPFFSSRRKKPPFRFRNRPRPYTIPPAARPKKRPTERKGCDEIAPLRSKKNSSMLEMVDFALMPGGEVTIYLRVSRIEVLEAMIALPEIVVSQYLRC